MDNSQTPDLDVLFNAYLNAKTDAQKKGVQYVESYRCLRSNYNYTPLHQRTNQARVLPKRLGCVWGK